MFRTVGMDLEDDLRSVNMATKRALHHWRARRADDFGAGMFGIEAELGILAGSGVEIGQALTDFARAWSACEEEVDELRLQAQRLEREMEDRSLGVPDPTLIDVERLAAEARIALLRHEAEEARRDLDRKAGLVADRVDDATRRLVPGGDRLSPADIRRRVDAATGVTGAQATIHGAWEVLSRARTQARLVLDLEVDNLEGLEPGGPVSVLPVDLRLLGRLLNAARVDGIPLSRCRGLLHQFWAAKAAASAGIALDAWDPALGVDGNRATISAVYAYYGRLFLSDSRKFQWAGMANMIGPSFAAGFLDLDLFGDLADNVLGPAEKLPDWAQAALPIQLRSLDAVGNLGADELAFYERTFLSMQKEIFFDQAAMHQAYVEGKMPEIRRMLAAGIIDKSAADAWTLIGRRNAEDVALGNKLLLDREQNKIIYNQYDQMREHNGPEGEAVTYLMTVIGEASIPGTKTPAEYSPLDFGAHESDGLFGVGQSTSVEVRTSLPDFNVSDRRHRWSYVENDTLPAFQRLLGTRPDLARRIVASDVDGRIEAQRLIRRGPSVAGHLLTDWDVDVEAEVHAGPFGYGS